MRSQILQQILDETPKEVDVFVKKYGDLVVRIHEIMEAQGINQRTLAERMDKKPSEISKWLSGNHNLTLRSIVKLEIELGVELIAVTQNEIPNAQPSNIIPIQQNKNLKVKAS